jgi:hypothetical protein
VLRLDRDFYPNRKIRARVLSGIGRKGFVYLPQATGFGYFASEGQPDRFPSGRG